MGILAISTGRQIQDSFLNCSFGDDAGWQDKQSDEMCLTANLALQQSLASRAVFLPDSSPPLVLAHWLNAWSAFPTNDS